MHIEDLWPTRNLPTTGHTPAFTLHRRLELLPVGV
jgi:hypothetical protein